MNIHYTGAREGSFEGLSLKLSIGALDGKSVRGSLGGVVKPTIGVLDGMSVTVAGFCDGSSNSGKDIDGFADGRNEGESLTAVGFCDGSSNSGDDIDGFADGRNEG